MLRRLHDRIRGSRLHVLAIGGAWLFLVVSLMHLGGAVGTLLDDPAASVSLYESIDGEQTHGAWGLTYSGVAGLMRASTQALLVIAASLATLPLARRWSRACRAGHVILCVWSAWWTLSVFALAAADPQASTVLQALLLTTLTGCTAYRAVGGWPRRAARVLPEPRVAPDGIEPVGTRPEEPLPDQGGETPPSEPVEAPNAWERVLGRLGDAAARTKLTHRAAEWTKAGVRRVRPLAATAFDRSRALGGRIVRWLRDSAVLPAS